MDRVRESHPLSGPLAARGNEQRRTTGGGGRHPEAACTFSTAHDQVLTFMHKAGVFVSRVKLRIFPIVHPRLFSKGKDLPLIAEPLNSKSPCKNAHHPGPAEDKRGRTRLPPPAPTEEESVWDYATEGAQFPREEITSP